MTNEKILSNNSYPYSRRVWCCNHTSICANYIANGNKNANRGCYGHR